MFLCALYYLLAACRVFARSALAARSALGHRLFCPHTSLPPVRPTQASQRDDALEAQLKQLNGRLLEVRSLYTYRLI